MELDSAYSNVDAIRGAANYPPRWQEKAAGFVAEMGDRARMALTYGEVERHRFDLFLPEGAPHGLTVFVHGGYWLRFDRSYWSHLAAGALARGRAVAMPSYDLCPAVRISEITRQIAGAVTAAAREVDGPVSLTGHSAGGHLVARMLAPGMLPEDVAARLDMVVPISPLTELHPLMKTSMNDDLRLDDAEATAESPVNQPAPDVPVRVRVGAAELPAFIDHARWLSEAWGVPCDEVPGKHHFDVIDELADPDSPLVRSLTGAA